MGTQLITKTLANPFVLFLINLSSPLFKYVPYMWRLYHWYMDRKISADEQNIVRDYKGSLVINARPSHLQPIIICPIAPIGGGVSSVLEALSAKVNGTIGDRILLGTLLRRKGLGQDNCSTMCEEIALHIVSEGGTALVDSNYVDRAKRESMVARAKKIGARVIFIHIHCDLNVIIDRIMYGKLSSTDYDYFGEASGGPKVDNQVEQTKHARKIKMTEMQRRYPLNYPWTIRSGGSFNTRRFNADFQINTTDEKTWVEQITYIDENL